MASIPGLESIPWFQLFSKLAYYLGWTIGGLAIVAVMVAAYFWFTYSISATVFELYGSGKDGAFAFSKPKMNKFKWIRNRSAWKPLFPLMNKDEVEPFDAEYIYPGNKVFAFKLNNEYFPGRVNINLSEDEIRAEVNPVPYYIRNWQSLQHKKNAVEFSEHNFWEDNKYFFMVVLTAVVCLTGVCVTIWLTYKYAGAGRADIQSLTNALKGVVEIPGRPPG